MLLEDFTHANYFVDLDKKRDLWSHIFHLYSNVVIWKVALQQIVDLFTIMCQSILGEAVKETVWLKGIVEIVLQEFIHIIHCDSKSVIHLPKNPSHDEWSKFIDAWFYFIREIVA